MGFIEHHSIIGPKAAGPRPEPNLFDADSRTQGATLAALTVAILLAVTVQPLG